MSRKEHTSSKIVFRSRLHLRQHPTHKQPSAGICAVQSTMCSTKTHSNHNFGARISTKSKTHVRKDQSQTNIIRQLQSKLPRIDTSCLSTRATYTSPIKDNSSPNTLDTTEQLAATSINPIFPKTHCRFNTKLP